MDQNRIDGLMEQLRSGSLGRRQFISRAVAAGLSAGIAGTLANSAVAQDASPSASPSPGASPAASPAAATEPQLSLLPGQRSINREEYYALIRENFEYEEPQSEGGLFIEGNTSDISTMNPVLSSDVYSSRVTGFVFEGLITSSPTNGLPSPWLADFWELAADGVTYTFHLNQAAMWHDGQPFTADDVVFTYDSILGEGSLSQGSANVAQVVESYRAVDDYTVEFVSKGPIATFLTDAISGNYIVARHIWESVALPDWGSDGGSTGADPSRVIGTGPFTFREWVVEDHVTLDKNPNYWDADAVPVIDEFTYRVIPEPSANVQALQAGETDMIDGVPQGQVEALRQDPNLNVLNYDNTGFNWYAANQDASRVTLFTEIPVRQAMMWALDRDLLAEQVYLGFALRAIGTQAPLSLAYDPERINTDYTYDPDRARQLLEEAGWVDSDGDGIRERDGQRFSFECLFSEGVATYEQQLPYMQQAWREVGIEMIPAAVPFPSLLDAVDTRNYQMAVYGFTWDVDGDQGLMYRCDATRDQGGYNSMIYCNERYDELDQAQRRELDTERRKDLLIEATNLVWDEQANGVLLYRQSLPAFQRRLHNVLPNGYGGPFWNISSPIPTWVEQ